MLSGSWLRLFAWLELKSPWPPSIATPSEISPCSRCQLDPCCSLQSSRLVLLFVSWKINQLNYLSRAACPFNHLYQHR